MSKYAITAFSFLIAACLAVTAYTALQAINTVGKAQAAELDAWTAKLDR